MLTSNSDESNFVICCCRSWLRPGTRTTSVCMFLPLFVLLSSLLRFRFRGVLVLESASSRPPTMSPPESSLARSSKPAEANKWRLLVASLLFTPPLASLPIDDHSSLVEMVLAQQIWKKNICIHKMITSKFYTSIIRFLGKVIWQVLLLICNNWDHEEDNNNNSNNAPGASLVDSLRVLRINGPMTRQLPLKSYNRPTRARQ